VTSLTESVVQDRERGFGGFAVRSLLGKPNLPNGVVKNDVVECIVRLARGQGRAPLRVTATDDKRDSFQGPRWGPG